MCSLLDPGIKRRVCLLRIVSNPKSYDKLRGELPAGAIRKL